MRNHVMMGDGIMMRNDVMMRSCVLMRNRVLMRNCVLMRNRGFVRARMGRVLVRALSGLMGANVLGCACYMVPALVHSRGFANTASM